MKVVLCDICKRQTKKWYIVDIRADASNSNLNVGDMVHNLGSFEICSDCLNKIKKEAKNED